MSGFTRATMAAILCGSLLAGCSSTTAVSTHGAAQASGPRSDLGVDHHGKSVGAAWPSIPASNQIGLKGDQSARMLQLGKENFRNDNFGYAERYFRQAVETRPDSADAWAGLAASYDQLGRFDLADRAYDQLLKLKRDDARVMNNRGYSYLLRGDYRSAEIWLKRAAQRNPALEEVEGNMHLLEKVRQG